MGNGQFYLLIVFAMSFLFGSVQAQKLKVARDLDSANILTVKKAGDDLPLGDLADAVEKYPNGKSTRTLSRNKRYQATVFCISSRSREVPDCVRRVFILDLRTDENYEIVGEELGIEAGRLISNLKWLDTKTLSYERWTTPHFGRRYVVDMKSMKQTGAFILSDQ